MPEIRLVDMRGEPRIAQKVSDALPTDPWERQKFANDVRTTPAQWQSLAHDPVFAIRYAAATSPYIPSALLAEMAHDDHPYVRAGVAYNPHTPDAALQTLLEDPDISVGNVAERNAADRQATRQADAADDLSV